MDTFAELPRVVVEPSLEGAVAELVPALARHLRSTVVMGFRSLRLHDEQTAGHSNDVANWALRLCMWLRLDEHECRIVGLGSIFHDIGKIGVPDSILYKPGELNGEEWRRVREHPAYGRHVLEPVPEARPILPLVYSHHERLDGKGYPEGLRGKQLSLGVRVLSIADAYDAMVAPGAARPYREPVTEEEAVAELERGAGTQFDPQLVRAFADMLSDRHTVLGSTA
jgi:HD-GYP domain-containing protein (c-di-GMP phosphodiesterase class II)